MGLNQRWTAAPPSRGTDMTALSTPTRADGDETVLRE